MSGHSKWSTIKHKKAAKDARRASAWTKIIKEIAVAAREGGPDPDGNPRLRLCIQNAKGVNIPKDNIERAIKKGAGGEGDAYVETTYEGYAPHGIAIFIEAMTDNTNRTVANVRAIFTKYSGNLGTNGSLEFLFDRKGVFTIDAGDIDEEMLALEAIDAGAEDFEREGDVLIITTPYQEFGTMQKKLEELSIVPASANLERIPNNTTTLSVEDAKKVLAMVEKFEDDEDVKAVYHNLEMTDELAEALES